MINETFTFFFYMNTLKSTVHSKLTVHPKVNAKFPLEIFDLYFDFIKLTVGKVDGPTQDSGDLKVF